MMLSMPEPPAIRPRRKKRLMRFCLFALGALVLIPILAAVGGMIWLRTDAAHGRLRDVANAALADSLKESGLEVRLTSLSGELPFRFVAGVEVADAEGVWLTAEEIRFHLDWRSLPDCLHIRDLSIVGPELGRLPVLPPSPPPPPSPPLTQDSLRAMLEDAVGLVHEAPDWLPAVRLDRISVENALLPAGIVGAEARAHVSLSGRFAVDGTGPVAEFALTRLECSSSLFNVKGGLQWRSGGRGIRWLDGPFALQLDAGLSNGVRADGDSPLAMLRAPATLSLNLAGTLFAPKLSLEAACADLRQDAHRLENARVTLKSEPLAWAALLGLAGERGRGELSLDVAAMLNDHPINLATGLFAELSSPSALDQVAAGLRDFRLNALGATGSGDMRVAIMPGALPLLDGDLRLHIADWEALSAFVPGLRLSGEVSLAAHCVVAERGQGGRVQQDARLTLDIPRFSLTSGKEPPLHVKGLKGLFSLRDVAGEAKIDGQIDLADLRRENLHLSLGLGATGALQGPLALRFSSSGSATSAVRAVWRPGEVLLERLEAQLPSHVLLPDGGKGTTLGVTITPGAKIRYGDAGFAVQGLDARLTPSGRLQADGGLAPEKLNLRFALRDLDLVSWRPLVKDLPVGKVEAGAELSGNPQRPVGNFRLGVRGLEIPGARLAPLHLALKGSLAHRAGGTSLDAALELPQDAVKALGGKEARLRASLPLVFDASGIPAPDMAAPFSAELRWQGGVGPLWNLLPLADRRLSGDIGLRVDASGSLAAPVFKADVRMLGARFEDVALGAMLRDINMRLDVDGKAVPSRPDPLTGSLKLEMSAADGMGGSLRIEGGGGLDADNLHIVATLDRLRPLRRQDLRIALSGKAEVSGKATAPTVRGDIVINQGTLSLNDISPGASFTTLPVDEAGKGGKAPPQAGGEKSGGDGGGTMDVRIHAPGRFMVDGRGLASEWQTNLRIAGPLASPSITGELRSVKGNLDFMGKNFVLSRGVVTFAGGSPSNPLVDMLLTNEAPNITAHIGLSGPAQKLQLSLTSEPHLPRDEVLSQILFGRNVNELSRLEALQLAGALAQLAGMGSGGGAMDFTRKALGVDVLRLNSSGSGKRKSGNQEGMEGATIEMGKYLNDYIYVGVEQGAKQGSTAATIQLEATPRIKFEVRTEQNNTSGGVSWRYNY